MNNSIIGTHGSDTLTGAEGEDRFVLRRAHENVVDTLILTEEIDTTDKIIIKTGLSDHNLFAEVIGFDESDRIRFDDDVTYQVWTNRLGNTNLIIQDGDLTHVIQFQGVDEQFVEDRIILFTDN